jgi:hypothetical protein
MHVIHSSLMVRGILPSLDVTTRSLPRFLHALTGLHALGALACFIMALGSAASSEFREALAVSEGSTLMVRVFGHYTWVFLIVVGSVLAVLAYLSWRVRPQAWLMTLVVYGIGIVGSLWQVTVGIPQGWVAAVVNGGVFLYASTPAVRRAYTGR